MKKLTAILVSAALALCLTACGDSSTGNTGDAPVQNNTAAAQGSAETNADMGSGVQAESGNVLIAYFSAM
ncbi:MAG: hypothetical protein Q4D42_10325, partial [Eubacteriales bacterium]|nr:hypothetical protein [Eubacteriales bacterium]